MSSKPHIDEKTRVAAFAAIRRAAEVARAYDNRCTTYQAHGDQTNADYYLYLATGCRDAIRAAIASDKS